MAENKVQGYDEYSDEKLSFVRNAVLEAIVIASDKGHNIDQLIKVLEEIQNEENNR